MDTPDTPLKRLWQEKMRFLVSRGCPLDEASEGIEKLYPKLLRAVRKEYRNLKRVTKQEK